MLRQPELGDIGEAMATLVGGAIESVEQVRNGRNNEIFRVTAAHGSFAVKRYPRLLANGHDRLATEYGALTFLRGQGIRAVPAPIGRADAARMAAYEWIDGHPPDARERRVRDLADFFLALLALREAAAGADIGGASACCFSLADTIAQLRARRASLRAVQTDGGELDRFLGLFDKVAARAVARSEDGMRAAGMDPNAALAPSLRCLSPSDFGFHNALLRDDGTVVFFDFEYFGWDDPVKAVADIMLHPGMELSPEEGRTVFEAVAERLDRDDKTFRARFAALYPLYALIWGLIILNEFIPDYAARRAAAGVFGNAKEEFLARQIAKAHHRLSRVANDLEQHTVAAL